MRTGLPMEPPVDRLVRITVAVGHERTKEHLLVRPMVVGPLDDALVAQAGGWAGPARSGVTSRLELEGGVATAELPISAELEPAATNLLTAIHTGDYSSLAHKAHEELYGISNSSVWRNWTVTLQPSWEAPRATIGAGHPVPEPEPVRLARGGTTIYGEVIAIGRSSGGPWARLRRDQGGEVGVSLTAELEPVLRDRLGSVVGLDGQATWECPSWRIVAFEATRLLRYRESGAAEAFGRLREVVGDAFDGVDPLDYTRRLREGLDL